MVVIGGGGVHMYSYVIIMYICVHLGAVYYIIHLVEDYLWANPWYCVAYPIRIALH